jgi:hypothetical protein
VGSGYLAVPVFSAIYLGPSVLAAKAGGLPAVCLSLVERHRLRAATCGAGPAGTAEELAPRVRETDA